MSFSQELTWKIQDPRTQKWISLGTKGSVQEAYINSGLLPDPFVGENEKLFAWIENYDWTFEAVLKVDSIHVGHEYDLDFPSIDTYAKIYVNDVLCGSAENSFIHYYFSVTKLLKKGENKIRVVFQSPVKAKKKEAETFVYPAPNDAGKVKVAPYCRKPQYQFGWDWSLRMITMGFWEPASLVSYKSNCVIGKSISTFSVIDNKAEQNHILFLRNDFAQAEYIWESKLYGTKTVTLWDSHVVRTDFIENPVLWWPRGQGEQFLYEDVWTLKTISGEILYHDTILFGVRTSKVVQEKDQWGTSFVIHVNDRPMFCKGADYIPDNIFPAKITDEQLRNSVRTMAESNFNMVRIWGGGMYAKESFLEECDKRGIMVWHDFMFACAMYPGNDAFLKNVGSELEQQIPRIASHPSLVYFNGNNEVDVAWKNWGFQQTFNLSKESQTRIAADYDKLFKELIPESISAVSNVPYVHTSPLSNWGNDDFYNHGTQHYWGVWHGKDPMNNMGTKIGRFNAEYGFQSFPEYSTLLKFSKTSEWSLESANMKQHQKSYVGNSMIAKHADLLFGKSKSFEDFVYFSQLTQAEAVETAVNAHRIDKPRCSGTLFWQYNDCWPAISWSSIDYYGNWKALQYRIKSSYEDVAILKDKTNPGMIYYIVSDIPTGYLCRINCEITDLEGKLLANYNCQRAVLNESSRIFENELAPFQNENCFVKFTWTKESGELLYFNDLHLAEESTFAEPSVELSELVVDETTKTGTIQVTSSALARDFWIYSTQIGVHFTNNFVLLQSGRHKFEFTFTDKKPELSDFSFKFR
jgi:beta-mannosidase